MSSKRRQWLLVLAIISLPCLTSCFSATLGGHSLISLPNYFHGEPYLQFERKLDPCIRESSVIIDDLYDGEPAKLWKDRGNLHLIVNGDVEEAYYIYRPGGLRERYNRGDRLGRPIYGPEWKLDDVRNAGTNTEITLIVVIFLRGQAEPWVGKFPIYNQNLRTMCQGYKN